MPLNDESEAQYNFRVPTSLKRAYLAACDHRGTNGTEALTRFMTAYVEDTLGDATLHLDGSMCPVSQLINSLTTAVLASLNSSGQLDLAARTAIFNAVAPSQPEARQ